MDSESLRPASEEAKFLHIPYNDRWELLKPVILQLYLENYGPRGNTMTIPQVAEFMKNNYSFHGAPTQYRRWFRQWDIRKRVLKSEKDAIASALGRRAHPGTSAPDVTLHQGGVEKSVDKRQFKRQMRSELNQNQVVQMSPGVLSSWNLPYAAYAKAFSGQADQPSPFGQMAATPQYLAVHSPEAVVTPGSQAAAAPSPTMELVQRKVIRDRSSLLLQGRHVELISSCGREDRIALTNYLHDFHIHSLVTAKYWGRGPRFWTPGMISLLTQGSLEVAHSFSSPAAHSETGGTTASGTGRESTIPNQPTQLCRWSIHVPSRAFNYDEISEPQGESQTEFDIQEPSSWAAWSANEVEAAPSFPDTLQESITDGTFTSTTPEELPISTQVVTQSVHNDPAALGIDSWKFAIMAGNVGLVQGLGKTSESDGEEILKVHPFHLAATYLDGSNSCCLMICALFDIFGPGVLFRHNIDDMGHTVLDYLLMSVLRSHTSVGPENVSTRLDPPNRYPGEEKDICGRWDSDSPAVRELFQRGYPRIPIAWKHPLCHTAVQAICHTIIAIFGSPPSPNIDTPSGLFVRRCRSCGTELSPGPLHVVVIVAFYLAQSGRQGETMFGALAILVCLLRLGANASLSVAISIEDILGNTDAGECLHKPLSPLNLMEAIPGNLVDRWTEDCQVGWRCIVRVLLLEERSEPEGKSSRREEDSGSSRDLNEDSEEGSDEDSHEDSEGTGCILDDEREIHGEWLKLPCGNPDLGVLWATIQVELLTYRRVEAGAPWISDNFSMHALKAWLDGETEVFHTPLVEKGMMRKHSRCGWFPEHDLACPIAEEVCEEYFMNMDIHHRATFLQRPELSHRWADYM